MLAAWLSHCKHIGALCTHQVIDGTSCCHMLSLLSVHNHGFCCLLPDFHTIVFLICSSSLTCINERCKLLCFSTICSPQYCRMLHAHHGCPALCRTTALLQLMSTATTAHPEIKPAQAAELLSWSLSSKSSALRQCSTWQSSFIPSCSNWDSLQ